MNRISMIVSISFVALCFVAVATVSATSDLANEDSQQTLKTNVASLFSNRKRNAERTERTSAGDDRSTGRTCTVEYEETRRVEGRCTVLFGGQQACKAGDWMNPMLNGECD